MGDVQSNDMSKKATLDNSLANHAGTNTGSTTDASMSGVVTLAMSVDSKLPSPLLHAINEYPSNIEVRETKDLHHRVPSNNIDLWNETHIVPIGNTLLIVMNDE